MFPSKHFNTDGLLPPQTKTVRSVELRVSEKVNVKKHGSSGEQMAGARKLVVDAIGGLQFKQKRLEAKPGEALALTLRNTDVMPHNLVLVKPNGAQKVGTASFKMLTDPKAGQKHYVPDLPEVINYIPVINPGTEHVLNFRAPTEPGIYPYICTFPGHWQVMRGILVVKD